MRGGEELCPGVGRMDMMRISGGLALPGTISPASRSSSYFVPGSDLISPDQTLSGPRVTRLIRHQAGDSAGSSPPLKELTRRQFVARVSDSAINPSYPVHTVVNTPRVHTEVTWA